MSRTISVLAGIVCIAFAVVAGRYFDFGKESVWFLYGFGVSDIMSGLFNKH